MFFTIDRKAKLHPFFVEYHEIAIASAGTFLKNEPKVSQHAIAETILAPEPTWCNRASIKVYTVRIGEIRIDREVISNDLQYFRLIQLAQDAQRGAKGRAEGTSQRPKGANLSAGLDAIFCSHVDVQTSAAVWANRSVRFAQYSLDWKELFTKCRPFWAEAWRFVRNSDALSTMRTLKCE